MTTAPRFKTFAEFWPYYLSEHANPRTRALHFAGTSGVVVMLALALWTRWWPLLWALPLSGYGLAWVSHFTIEKNRPATFKYPLWSLRGDLKMWAMTLTGKLGAELRRVGNDRGR